MGGEEWRGEVNAARGANLARRGERQGARGYRYRNPWSVVADRQARALHKGAGPAHRKGHEQRSPDADSALLPA